ncbi:MAG: hypothetical protein V3R81_07575, partial [Gammaproteobacteria bacterium]
MASNIGLWGRLAVLLAISIIFAACDGSDGAPGAAGAPGADGPAGSAGPEGPPAGYDPVAEAKAESCATCHGGVGVEEHQAEYNKYAGTAFALTITNVSSTPQGTIPETWDATMTIHLEKDGVPVSGLHSFTTPWGTTVLAPTGVDQASFYTVQYISGTRTFDNSNSFSMDLTSDLGSGDFEARATGVAFDPVPANGQAYAYVAGGLLDTEGMALYQNVTNTSVAYGDVGTYASAANVEGCETCHGTPYLKHGYRAPKVSGLPDFASCKSCHYDDRNGGHRDWQYMVDQPLNWANGVALAPGEYDYKAKLMNDVHMAHAMEFPFPQSMANCATCHEGKLDRILANTNFTLETCKSCHPIKGTDAWPQIGERGDPDYVAAEKYNQSGRPPPLEYLWKRKGVDEFHDPVAFPNCQGCHGAGVSPPFNELHSGYDKRISNAAGVKYRDLYTASIDSVSIADPINFPYLLTIEYSTNDVAISPPLLVSFYGWDSKHFIIPSHTRDGTTLCNGRGCRMEYTPGDTNPLFTEDAASVPGDWKVTLDMAAFQSIETDDIPTMIAAGKIKKAEITITPRLTLDGVPLGLNAVTHTFDLGAGMMVNDYFKGANATVDTNKCNVCHNQLAVTWHSGRGRGGDIVACKNCHNPTYTGSHVEMASRSIENYVHAIHSFQDFDPGDTFAVFDPVLAKRYDQHVKHVFPNFTIKNCEACHLNGTYNVPDQFKSLPGALSKSDELATWYKIVDGLAVEDPAGRNIGSVPEVVTGPASRACGGCHRAHSIKTDAAGDLAAFNAHTQAGGTFVENDPDNDPPDDPADEVLFAIIDKIMS